MTSPWKGLLRQIRAKGRGGLRRLSRGTISGVAVLAGLAVLHSYTGASVRTNLDHLAGEAVHWLSGYIRAETINPPGKETRGAEYLNQLLRREGISSRILVSAPGRANVYARLKGRSADGALALVHHIDVVPADEAAWSVPPFGGVVREGYVWGRGAVDAKGLGIAHLAVVVALKRAGVELERDVVFLATADEEAGGAMGLAWLLRNHPQLFTGIRYALTEGGHNILRDGRLAYLGIETTQKTPVWVRVTARARSGHSAYQTADSAPQILVRALDRLLRYRPPLILSPAVARYLDETGPFQAVDLRGWLGRVENPAADPSFARALSPDDRLLLRNTIAVTVLKAGGGANYVPDTAYAELDCRLVPSEDPEDFLHTLAEVVDDPRIDLEPLLVGKAFESPLDTELVGVIQTAASRFEPSVVVGPAVLAGFSDSRLLREAGIVSYGFDPFLRKKETRGPHGVDERLPISELGAAVRFCHEVVRDYAAGRRPSD